MIIEKVDATLDKTLAEIIAVYYDIPHDSDTVLSDVLLDDSPSVILDMEPIYIVYSWTMDEGRAVFVVNTFTRTIEFAYSSLHGRL